MRRAACGEHAAHRSPYAARDTTSLPFGRPESSLERQLAEANPAETERGAESAPRRVRSDRSDCAAAPRTSASACSSRSWPSSHLLTLVTEAFRRALFGPSRSVVGPMLLLPARRSSSPRLRPLALRALLFPAERHAQLAQQRERLVVLARRRDERDVHAVDLLHLVVVDLREDHLLLDAEV